MFTWSVPESTPISIYARRLREHRSLLSPGDLPVVLLLM
jgi:hypothetical protein